MKRIIVLFVLVFAIACSDTKKEGNLIVQGKIKGLKKGTLYLQKMQDTAVVAVDSISLLSQEVFSLTDDVESPEVYYLTLSDNNTNKNVLFFAEAGTITINDNINTFGVEPQIEGSKNQEILDKFTKMKNQFNNRRIDNIKAQFDAQKAKDTKKADSLKNVAESLLKRQYLFAVNFAMTHGDYEAAPYIALTELVDANVKLLDTINHSLSDKVKSSLYGKKLENFIAEIKKTEK